MVLALGTSIGDIGADVLSGWGVEGFRWRSESSFSLIFEVSLMSVWRNSRNNSWTPKKCWKRKVSPGCFKLCFGLKGFMFFFLPVKKNRKLHLMGSEASQRPTMSQFHNFGRPNSKVHPRHDGTLCYNETSGHKAAPVSSVFFEVVLMCFLCFKQFWYDIESTKSVDVLISCFWNSS